MDMTHVEGSDKGNIKLFTLSTCVWCKKTKAFLREMDIGYNYVDVDLLEGKEREDAVEELKHFNPRCSFPSLIIADQECIVGYNEEKIREVLKL